MWVNTSMENLVEKDDMCGEMEVLMKVIFLKV